MTIYPEQIGSVKFSAVFLSILIQRILSTQWKNFKKGVTWSNLQDLWEYYILSFLSVFRAQRCRCRTWQINLQVRNNPEVFSGAEPPHRTASEEHVLPFSARLQNCTVLIQERCWLWQLIFLSWFRVFFFIRYLSVEKKTVHQNQNLSQEKVSFNKCSPFRKKYQKV